MPLPLAPVVKSQQSKPTHACALTVAIVHGKPIRYYDIWTFLFLNIILVIFTFCPIFSLLQLPYVRDTVQWSSDESSDIQSGSCNKENPH